jgi:hypothetical protein
MIDLYLKAASQAAAFTALLPLGIAVEEGETARWIAADERFALDAAIPVIETPETFDGEGTPLTPAIFEPGFFLNVRLTPAGASLAAALALTGLVLDPPPATPARLWA